MIASLRRYGLTIDEISDMDEAEMLAWSVAFGQLSGGEWDWSRMR
jgi:hypothetical protein